MSSDLVRWVKARPVPITRVGGTDVPPDSGIVALVSATAPVPLDSGRSPIHMAKPIHHHPAITTLAMVGFLLPELLLLALVAYWQLIPR